jgi:hypothetical protein
MVKCDDRFTIVIPIFLFRLPSDKLNAKTVARRSALVSQFRFVSLGYFQIVSRGP